jgi:lactate permease
MMTLVAAIPILVLLVMLGVLRKPAWVASLCGLAAAIAVALFAYDVPVPRLAWTVASGAAYGLFPIGWVVFAAILLYRIILESGKFDILRDSIGHLTDDPKLQALLVAFAFGAFIEGAAGFGTPVAVAAAMLTGLGFQPFYAAAICLLANTAPVAFGSIATPIIALAGTTELPMDKLSAAVGRICAPVSLFIPAYLILVMAGLKGLREVFGATMACGIAFAGTQFLVSNYIGPQLTDILSSMAAMGAVLLMLPKRAHRQSPHSGRELMLAWAPYILLIVFVLLWGYKPLQAWLDTTSISFKWPELADKPAFKFNWLSASGTSCLFAAILGAWVLGLSPSRFLKVFKQTAKQLALPELTLAAVLALARTMDYSGATNTLGVAFAATGQMFPFFSAMIGWLGVFLTGSDTSANVLFGKLQTITAGQLGLNPILMAASNSSGGVMGKMISLTSIAVAAAATQMKREDEALLFRFTMKHSVLLAAVIGMIVMFYAYVMPGWAPS